MARVEGEGKLDEWCADNVKWLEKPMEQIILFQQSCTWTRNTAYLCHYHADSTGSLKEAEKGRENMKRKYKVKAPAPHMSADEVIGRAQSYALLRIAMKSHKRKYGLKRGIRGSVASTSPRMNIIATLSCRVRTYRRTSLTCWQGGSTAHHSRGRGRLSRNSHASRRRQRRWN